MEMELFHFFVRILYEIVDNLNVFFYLWDILVLHQGLNDSKIKIVYLQNLNEIKMNLRDPIETLKNGCLVFRNWSPKNPPKV